ncbi:MAG TPA: hypothetical protein VFY20_09085 [Gemmatimonadales bacterium]|nr:hypothetical protein [Gemmatimonadales bacterium]
MSLVLPLHRIALTHRVAPLAVRAPLVAAADDIRTTLGSTLPDGAGVIVLATCNRFEVQGWGDPSLPERARALVASVRPDAVARLEVHEGRPALTSMIRVAAGLDSLVRGEREIVGQMRRAWLLARRNRWTVGGLDRLVPMVMESGRRVRARLQGGRVHRSVASAAVELAARHLGPRRGEVRVAVLGAGTVAGGVLEALPSLASHDALQVTVIARRQPRGMHRLVRPWTELAEALVGADVVFVATGAARPVLDHALLAPALSARRGAPVLVVDLAVPPNVAADVRAAPGVQVLDVDDLPAGVPAPVAAESETLVAEEVDACLQEMLVRSTAPRLSELHQEGESLVSEELVRTFGALGPLAPEVQVEIERLAHRLARRLLFPASHAVRDVAREAWPPFPTCSGCQRTHPQGT